MKKELRLIYYVRKQNFLLRHPFGTLNNLHGYFPINVKLHNIMHHIRFSELIFFFFLHVIFVRKSIESKALQKYTMKINAKQRPLEKKVI